MSEVPIDLNHYEKLGSFANMLNRNSCDDRFEQSVSMYGNHEESGFGLKSKMKTKYFKVCP